MRPQSAEGRILFYPTLQELHHLHGFTFGGLGQVVGAISELPWPPEHKNAGLLYESYQVEKLL